LPAFWPALSCLLVVAMTALPHGKLTYLLSVIAVPPLVSMGTANPTTTFESRLYGLLGEVSYPIYAIHFPIVMAVQALLHLDGAERRLSLAAALGLAGFVVLLALCLSRLWDAPIRVRLTSWLSARSPRHPDQSSPPRPTSTLTKQCSDMR
jgi:peptidoglycan/LPS O-acetylase OafA/YrhL